MKDPAEESKKHTQPLRVLALSMEGATFLKLEEGTGNEKKA